MRYFLSLCLAATASPALAQEAHNVQANASSKPSISHTSQHQSQLARPQGAHNNQAGHHSHGPKHSINTHDHSPAHTLEPTPEGTQKQKPKQEHGHGHGHGHGQAINNPIHDQAAHTEPQPALAADHAANPNAHSAHGAHQGTPAASTIESPATHHAPMEAHPGHAPSLPNPPIAGPSAAAFSGPAHAADTVFGAQAMAPARAIVRKEHGDINTMAIMIDTLEAVIGKGRNGYAWDAQAWYGGDINKLWIKTEGEGAFGQRLEKAEIQALLNHALDPWWNLQAGIRQDLGAGPKPTYAVIGVQGLAPYWFDISSALFLSDKGRLTARFKAEYDQRLTQKLILQPSVELNLSAQNIAEQTIGAGLSTAAMNMRLRYEFIPEIAPYIGVKYERAFGKTADYRQLRGDPKAGWKLLLGIRTWF